MIHCISIRRDEMRAFTVQTGVMGYVVSIGCQVAGFSNKKDLIKAITEYIKDPEATEKKYYKTAGYSLTEADMRQYGRTATEQAAATATAIAEPAPSLAEELHTAFTEPTQGATIRRTRT
jgi:hypothetical protein